jgi:hypothetical protein
MATNETQTPEVDQPKFGVDPIAGLLSYLIPGLGQIYQGRLVKGVVFLVCLWGLFFYGLYLGDWQNVYFPPLRDKNGQDIPNHGDLKIGIPAAQVLLGRNPRIPHVPFLAQFGIGIAAWPAIIQAASYDVHDLSEQGRGAAKEAVEHLHPFLGKFQRYPDPTQQENMLRNGDKYADLGWIYTIIAGLLNLLVIYDALAGPAHGAQSIPLTSFLMFLVALTGLCAIGLVVAVYLTLAGDLAPTLYLQLPVVLALVSLVYSATRFERWRPILLEAVHWGWRMTAFLLAIGVILYIVARPSLLAFAGW